MVRSYMRHGPTQAFGMICSPTANSCYDGRLAYVAGWEDILVWDVKRGEMVSMWHSPSLTAQITYLLPAPSPLPSSSTSPQTFAVSYHDGSIRLWSYSPSTNEEPSELVTFNGHKKSISTLSWDAEGTRLGSGGTEGEIVIWDRVAEVGLFRLKGHRGAITGLEFIPHPRDSQHPGYLVTVSKDTFMKLWDLGTQHCVQTVVVGRGEIFSLALQEETGLSAGGEAADDVIGGCWNLITGSGDGECKVWKIEKNKLADGMKEDANGELPKLIQPLCNLPIPNSTSPISQINFHPTLPLVFLQTSDRSTTILRVRSEEEVAAKRARRKKRDREKKKKGKKGEVEGDAEAVTEADGAEVVKWEERVTSWCTVRANAKVKSFSFSAQEIDSTKGGIPLLLSLSNNSLETYTIPSPSTSSSKASKLADGSSPEPTKTHSVELPGHRQDIRSLSISSDDQVIASASSGTLKVWNARTTKVIRTMECGYAICSTFLPGDRHVVIGTKSGELALYDIATSTLLSTYKAHTGPVWGINVRPDGRGLVSGSADKDVKFWDFEMREVDDGEEVVSRLGVKTVNKTNQLTLVHVKTLKMTDDVLAVKYSPDGRYLAVALLDSTVKIFFADTLKFFLSLYGHKLPVLSIDISSDSKLIVTCSADKNVKIWGMDFGDCHKSIFAHDESIMSVAFEKDSHYFWTVGKDRFLKYWDGDKFELIQKLEGHQGEIWALAVSHRGDFVVTGSHDKSIRIWEKTEEPLFLEEERERELELQYDDNLVDSLNNPRANGNEDGDEVEDVSKQTKETLMAGEKIMAAIEIADGEREAMESWQAEKERVGDGAAPPPPTRNPELALYGDISGSDYVLQTLKKVPNANMEDALLVLPFKQVVSLLTYLDDWANQVSALLIHSEVKDLHSPCITCQEKDIIITSKLLFFLIRTHSNQLISNRILRTNLISLRGHLRGALNKQRNEIGYNLAALKFIKGRWEGDRTAGILEEEGMDEEKVRKRLEDGKGKRKRVGVAV
ncbi:U3 small nucleolar RNA-associated protein 12, partial [Tremellales sp. Uapishka_1]